MKPTPAQIEAAGEAFWQMLNIGASQDQALRAALTAAAEFDPTNAPPHSDGGNLGRAVEIGPLKPTPAQVKAAAKAIESNAVRGADFMTCAKAALTAAAEVKCDCEIPRIEDCKERGFPPGCYTAAIRALKGKP